MRIPRDATIAPVKLVDYLLKRRTSGDKSGFLNRAGFLQSAPDVLEAAIRQLAADVEAVEDGANDYGTFWRIEGALVGPGGKRLDVIAIWIEWKVDGSVRFVTLKPSRRQS